MNKEELKQLTNKVYSNEVLEENLAIIMYNLFMYLKSRANQGEYTAKLDEYSVQTFCPKIVIPDRMYRRYLNIIKDNLEKLNFDITITKSGFNNETLYISWK